MVVDTEDLPEFDQIDDSAPADAEPPEEPPPSPKDDEVPEGDGE